MKYERRTSLKNMLAAGCAVSVGCLPGRKAGAAAQWAAAKDRPNFLLIVSDDQGAQMGALGTPEVHTPHMDSIGHDGILFKEAFVCTALCSPICASTMTSQYPHTSNTRDNVFEHFGPSPDFSDGQKARNDANAIPAEVPTLIEKLAEHGYRTGITSKLHMAPHNKFPFDAWVNQETAGVQKFYRAEPFTALVFNGQYPVSPSSP